MANTGNIRYIVLGQGVCYLVTGIWSLSSIRTFQAVTGPKTDLWLFKTVGVLVSVVGGVLVTAGLRRQERSPEVTMLSLGSAASLTAIESVYVARKIISPVYLADAAAELGIIAQWLWLPLSRRNRQKGAPDG